MNVTLANPRGFCAGVDRAIEIVERTLLYLGPPVFVRHEVVHNQKVVKELAEKGAIFVEELEQIPDGSTVVFSAHGVSKLVREEAKNRSFKVFDATCPLVTKVHLEVSKIARDGLECILIGHAGHPEVIGTLGQFDSKNGGRIYLVETEHDASELIVRNPTKLALVTQTTLSVDDTQNLILILKNRFPEIQLPRSDVICYATQNRQDAVKRLASVNDLVLVIGSSNSSNSNRLRELAERIGCKSFLIDGPEDLREEWFFDKPRIGVTAGASAPESIVKAVCQKLITMGGTAPEEESGIIEKIKFSLPKELRLVPSVKKKFRS